MGYTDKTLIKNLYKLMFNVHNLFVEYNVPYYVTGGTLLGAVRHKGIIPWDNDLDIEILEKDLYKLRTKKFRQALAKQNIKLRKHPEGWYVLDDMNSKASMDVFLSKYYPRKRTVELVGYSKQLFPKCSVWRTVDLFPLQKYKFGRIQVFGPQNPRPYLNSCYGKTWSQIGYITQDSSTHYDLDEPIKVPVRRFIAGRDLYIPTRKQLLPRKGNYIYTKEHVLST